jgi:hypothetical protein
VTIYTVHAPSAQDAETQALGLVFVPDRFSRAAFLFGPFWLAANRLWLALLGWIAVFVGLTAAAIALQAEAALPLLTALLAFGVGLEASALRRYGLARRGYRLIDVVAGATQDDAERAHFNRVAAVEPAWPAAPAPQSPATSGPAPSAPYAGRPDAGPAVLGLFPAAGRRA